MSLAIRLWPSISGHSSLAIHPQAQLDETHKLLHDEHKRRFKLEDDNTRLNLELQRIKVLLMRQYADTP